MPHYFGFVPSAKLNQMIDEAQDIINSAQKTDYYPYRNALVQQIAQELLDNLLVNLIEVIPNADRQATMKKIVNTIENSTHTLLKLLMGKDKNEQVMPSFHFMQQRCMFIDNEGQRRIGFQLEDSVAKQILTGFDSITPQSVDIITFQEGLNVFNDAILNHFLQDFTKTLNLGMIKRNAVSVAHTAIEKGLDMAIHKLLPQLNEAGLNRLNGFYRPFIIDVDSSN